MQLEPGRDYRLILRRLSFHRARAPEKGELSEPDEETVLPIAGTFLGTEENIKAVADSAGFNNCRQWDKPYATAERSWCLARAVLAYLYGVPVDRDGDPGQLVAEARPTISRMLSFCYTNDPQGVDLCSALPCCRCDFGHCRNIYFFVVRGKVKGRNIDIG